MAKMKAVQVTKANAPFELAERDIPEPGDREVRIRVAACGMCHSDAFVRSGAFPGLQLQARRSLLRMQRVSSRALHQLRKGEGHGRHARWGIRRVRCGAERIDRARSAGMEPIGVGPLLCAGVTTYNALRNSGARAGDTVAVQGIGGLGHLAIQYAAKMGFRTVAISSGADKEELARQLGAHEYVDTKKEPAAEGLKKLGGAHVMLATAPNSQAIASTFDGLTVRGKLLLVAAPHEPLTVPGLGLLSGRAVAGWPSGSAMDSEEAVAFSKLTGVKAHVERFRFDQAEEAYAKMMENRIRFRAVLTAS